MLAASGSISKLDASGMVKSKRFRATTYWPALEDFIGQGGATNGYEEWATNLPGADLEGIETVVLTLTATPVGGRLIVRAEATE